MANDKDSRSSRVRQRSHESVDRIMDGAEDMEARGKEELARLREKAAMMRGNVDGYIRNNPETAVLIAAGIGAIIGAMLTAAMMRNRH